MKKIALLAALLGSLSAFGAAQAANLVTNGSFEDSVQASGTWAVYNTLPGWATVDGSGIELRNDVAGQASDGLNYVELDAYGNSTMSQGIVTTAGAAYTLSFDYSARIGVGADSNPIEVFWNGQSIAVTTADGTGNGAHVWQNFSFDVVGTGFDTLSFRAIGINDSLGGSLDTVALTAAVPEPSTCALMALGLGLIGTTLRQRRRA